MCTGVEEAEYGMWTKAGVLDWMTGSVVFSRTAEQNSELLVDTQQVASPDCRGGNSKSAHQDRISIEERREETCTPDKCAKKTSEQGWVLWLVHEIPALGSDSKASLGSIEQANLIKEKKIEHEEQRGPGNKLNNRKLIKCF